MMKSNVSSRGVWIALSIFLGATGSVSSAGESAPARLQPTLERALQADFVGTRDITGPNRTTDPSSFVRADGRWTLTVELRGADLMEQDKSAGTLLTWASDHREGAATESGGRFGSTLELWIDPARIRDLAERDEVLAVRLPHRPFLPDPTIPSDPAVGRDAFGGETVTEALTAIRAPQFWDLGYQGQGVKVGIIDIGFNGFSERVGTELPLRLEARDFTGNGLPALNDAHGTACAEIVHDLAPEAEIYLAAIGTGGNLSSAVDWMIENDVDVISHSLAWFIGGGDGTGPIHDIVRRATDAGIIWVTSSGNFRLNHWTGPFRDADQDSWVELNSAGKESVTLTPVSASGRISLVLLWNRWPDSSDLSFQIDLFDGDTFRASSEPEYADSPFAYREVEFLVGPELADPNLRIRLTRGSPDLTTQLRIFRTDSRGLSPEDRVTAGSLTMPADAAEVIAVGAYSWRRQTIESFSSQGPTLTGLTKPEIIGPDDVSTSLSQYSTFRGTSAACPHVSGVAALLLSARIQGGLHQLRWSRNEVVRMLQHEADPIAGLSEDQQGAGRVRLILSRPSSSLLQVVQRDMGGLSLRLEASPGGTLPPTGSLSIHDVLGRQIAKVGGTRRQSDLEYRLDRISLAWASGRYYAREPKTGASVSFYWPGPIR